MTIKLTPESFLTGFRQSGLLSEERAEKYIQEMKKSGVDFSRADAIAQALVDRKIITEWQADKLLQGRHKGFLLGRYRLLSLLGKGEMSAVYLAKHVTMDRRCAIKVLPANRVKDTSYLGRFYREARAVAALNHPNIVSAYDVDFQSEGGAEIHFLVMEYVEGSNLEDLSKNETRLTIEQAVDYVRQGARGLAHAHDSGLIHRDIKPGNFLIDKNGNVKLLDLGLARFFNTEGEESLTIKHDEKVLGTADFLAPEQAIDSHTVDLRADIYSLGCTLYYSLTGNPPFTDGTLVQRLLAHQTKSPPSVKLSRPEIPDSLVEILEKMMAKQKEDRYQSARETELALEKWLVFNGSRQWKEKHVDCLLKHDALEMLLTPEKLRKLRGDQKSAPAEIISPAKNSSEKIAVVSSASGNSSSNKSSSSSSTSTISKPQPPRKKEIVEEVTFSAAPELKLPVSTPIKINTPASQDSDEMKTELLELKENLWILPTLTGLIVAAACLFLFALYSYFSGTFFNSAPAQPDNEVIAPDNNKPVLPSERPVTPDILAEDPKKPN